MDAQSRTHHGSLHSAPLYGMFFATRQGCRFIIPKVGVDEYSINRITACLRALEMPADGVDEQLESTVDRFNYYQELADLPPPPPQREAVTFLGEVVGVKPGPEFVIAE